MESIFHILNMKDIVLYSPFSLYKHKKGKKNE